MIKVASVILFSVVAIALGDGESAEIELFENGCPVNNQVYKIMPHEDCNKFYKCSNGERIEFKCPDKLMFNMNENVCDWPNQVQCENRVSTNAPDTTNPITESGDADPATICARTGSDGLLVPHEYCNRLYMCALGVPIEIECPDPLLFNTESQLCDYESKVDCGERLKAKENESPEMPEK
ncbi:peritrophin-1-like [Maniola jurtina]|uniref:peritrophin-1-like n=1 Tax=Maniola jurtina TaxID=191418 RepID=UPI001E68A5C0|nr:peritrophin-1-like [Maniola jurtina]